MLKDNTAIGFLVLQTHNIVVPIELPLSLATAIMVCRMKTLG